MKIIFLDIDGVLNGQEFMESIDFSDNTFPEQEFWSTQIDPDAVKILNELIQKSSAKVVISSSWRLGHSPEEMAEILETKGFVGEVIGETPVMRGFTRGEEIQTFVDNFGEDVSFVILDDDAEDITNLKHKLVHTSWECNGLRPGHVDMALKILENKDV